MGQLIFMASKNLKTLCVAHLRSFCCKLNAFENLELDLIRLNYLWNRNERIEKLMNEFI